MATTELMAGFQTEHNSGYRLLKRDIAAECYAFFYKEP